MAVHNPRVTNSMRILRESVNACARDMSFQLNRAFEEGGCSCSPLRKRLNQLNAECDRAIDQVHESEIFKEREALRQEIRDIDQKEHPGLDQISAIARPFFRVWLFERLTSAGCVAMESQENLAAEYVKAWFGGWRPHGEPVDEMTVSP